MNTKPILAYDCATTGASIALRVDGVTHSHTIGQTQQAAELVPAIDALLKAHRVSYADLGAIVTTTGPGSFTGVRIGLAALHGFVAVHSTPIKLLTTLEAIAWHATHDACTVALRAGKGEVYAQDFVRFDGKPFAQSAIMLYPESTSDWKYPTVSALPDAARMAEANEYLPLATLAEAVPHYIRPPDAIAPKPYAWLNINP